MRQVQLNSSRVCLLFLCASAVLICAGTYSGIRTARFIAHASLAEGTFIENLATLDTSENRLTYRPRIHFRTRDRQEISIISSFGAAPPTYQVGQTVALLYLPKRADEGGNSWLLGSLVLHRGAYRPRGSFRRDWVCNAGFLTSEATRPAADSIHEHC